MAEKKITGYDLIDALADADLIEVVDDVVGTPTSKKSTFTKVKAFLKTYFDTLFVPKSTFTQDGGIIVGTGAGAYQEETGTTLRTSIGAGTGDGDVTAAANIADEALVLGDGGAKGVKELALGTAYKIVRVNAGGTAFEVVDDSLSPWLIDIDVFLTSGDNLNWDSIVVDVACINNGRLSSSSQNDFISWPVVLSAGTWTFSLIYYKAANQGIYSVQFDEVEKGTIDGYGGSTTRNNVSTITGITVATPGKITLMLKMATKNGSSSGYQGNISSVRLIRTA